MNTLLNFAKNNFNEIRKVNRIIFITDRYGICDLEKSNPYRIANWRREKWLGVDGTPIKNKELLDLIDKNRKKICQILRCSVEIIYKPEKENKVADGLSKQARKSESILEIQKSKLKVGKRKYDGETIKYSYLSAGESFDVHVFLKEKLKNGQWEISVEIEGLKFQGRKMKILCSPEIEKEIHRRHIYNIVIKEVKRYKVTIDEQSVVQL